MNWNDILKPYSPRMLSYMCSAFGLNEYVGKVTPSNRLRVIDLLRRRLGKQDTVHSALEMVGPAEIAIIRTLISSGGHADTETVRRTLSRNTDSGVAAVKVSTPGAAPTPAYQGVPSFEDAALRATCYGLVFTRDNHEIDIAPGKFMFIPEPVLNILNTDAAWKKVLTTTAVHDSPPIAVATPDVIVTVSAADFQRDLSRYVRHVRKQKAVALTTVGWIYKTNFKTFLAALNAPADAANDEASNGRLWFMRRLLTRMGELNFNDSTLTPNPTGGLLTIPMAQRVKHAFEAWSETGAWNELNRIATEHMGFDYRRDAPPELTKARAVITRLITRLATPARSGTAATPVDSAERWIGTAQLVDLIRRSDYQFLFPRKYNYRDMYGSTAYYNTPYYGTNNPFNMSFPNITDEKSGWDEVERQVIVNVLTGPLYWMGLISLGYAKGQTAGEGIEPVAFRLTPTGAWLLGLATQPEFIETGGRVLVQPNFTIIAMEPISDAVLLALDEFAESQGGDRAITYHLTRQSVYQAQRQGWTAKRISAFLEQHQGAPISSNVQRSLDEWQLQHQRITFHRSARVIQYADFKARDGARQALQQAGLSTQPLAPTYDLIESGVESHQNGSTAAPIGLSAVLNAAGWLPLITPPNDAGAHTQNSLRLNDAAEVLFKESVPSLFTLSQVMPFAEQDGERLRISAPSIRAAMANGVQLDQLLATLKHLHGGALPAKVENNIRAWAGFYGNATLRAVHMLELSSLEVLNNLLADETVGGYLRPIDANVYPLALIDAANVERVRNVLIERGVTLK